MFEEPCPPALLAADPLITDTQLVLTAPTIVTLLLILGGITLLFAGPLRESTASFLIGLVSILTGVGAMLAGAAPLELAGVDMARLAEVVSTNYAIDAPTLADDHISEGSLCAPVSPDSPMLEGVVEGRQITFKVGVPDCGAAEPGAEILIVDAPEGVTAESLRKG